MPEYTIKCEDIMVMFRAWLVAWLITLTKLLTKLFPMKTIPLKVIETEPMLSQKKIADIIGGKYSTDFFLFQD